MRFAALGRAEILYDSIRACMSAGHQPVLIGTCEAAPEYKVKERDFEDLAAEIGCPFFCDPAVNKPQYIEMVRESRAEIAISWNWLTLIGQQLLDQFPLGVVNAHTGDLPRFRGNACPNWAILVDEPRIVVTLHRMVVELDAGPILLQRSMDLKSDTYIGDVYEFLRANVPDMFSEVLTGLASAAIAPRPQSDDPALGLRCYPRIPEDSMIDWSRNAEEIARLVRASAEPFSGAYTFIGSERLTIWKARSERFSFQYLGVPGQVAEIRKNGDVSILSGQGVLVLQEVELERKGRTQPSAIIRSTRKRLGMNLHEELRALRKRVEELERQVTEDNTG